MPFTPAGLILTTYATNTRQIVKIHYAQIVDEPENAPTLVLAKSEEELLQKLKVHSDLQHLVGIQDITSIEEIQELWEDDFNAPAYSGVFVGEDEL